MSQLEMQIICHLGVVLKCYLVPIPIAIAVPGLNEPPIVLDMATTVAAYGKVKTAAQRGEEMPEGWMIDRRGAASNRSK